MNRRFLLAATLLFGTITQSESAHAKPQVDGVMVYGIYTESCGAWTTAASDRMSVKAQVYKWWLLGFVSGAASALPERLASTDSDGIEAWMTNYCGTHPLEQILASASKLVEELKRRAR